MKYEDSLDGKAGLLKHLTSTDALISSKHNIKTAEEMDSSINLTNWVCRILIN